MLFGTLFVVVGAVLIGIFGIVAEPTHSLDDLLRLFGRTSFVVYFTLLGVGVLAVLIVVCQLFPLGSMGSESYALPSVLLNCLTRHTLRSGDTTDISPSLSNPTPLHQYYIMIFHSSHPRRHSPLRAKLRPS